MALLRQTDSGPELAKTASAPMPSGVVKDGRINDAAALASTIRTLAARNKIKCTKVAVSLFAGPVLMQIMDVPKQMPANVTAFVDTEVRHYAALPAKDITFDYCGIRSQGKAAAKRLFVAAAARTEVTKLAKSCSAAGLEVEFIEPPLFSYVTAFGPKMVARKTSCSSLLALLRGSDLTLAVFRNNTLDFVRVKDCKAPAGKPGEYLRWIADQINAIIRYYDVELPETSGNWQITVIADTEPFPHAAEAALREQVPDADVRVITRGDIHEHIAFQRNTGTNASQLSAVAVGLAARLLDARSAAPRVNLLPKKIVRRRTTKKDTLIAANVAAALLLLMIMVVDVPAWMCERIQRDVARNDRVLPAEQTNALLDRGRQYDDQIETLSRRIKRIKDISALHRQIDWTVILSDLAKAAPNSVCITELSCRGGSKLSLEGLALSNQAVHLFTGELEKSENIDSASVVETEKHPAAKEFVRYKINCLLTTPEGASDRD